MDLFPSIWSALWRGLGKARQTFQIRTQGCLRRPHCPHCARGGITTLVEIEGLLNARPLTNLSASSDDMEPLTPNYFLIGRPNPYARDEPPSWQRFRTIQMIFRQFWKRWLRYYVQDLIERKKWFVHCPDLRLMISFLSKIHHCLTAHGPPVE